MRKALLILILIIPIVIAQTEIKGYVNDHAGILDEDSKAELGQLAKTLQESGTAEYAIVTVKNLEGRDIEGYAYELAEGVLGDKEKNNGLLLLVALEDQKYRFEVGRGLEPVLPDIIMGRIGREYLVENFRAGDYGKGILEASRAIQARVMDEKESEYYVQDIDPKIVKIIVIFILIAIILIIITIFAIISALKGNHKSDDYFVAAIMAGSLMGRGGGGSIGGFGGFGGGSFGGGGASGGW